jgi:putative endonuclease
MPQYYVYIMSSRNRVLYTGVTGNLVKRCYEHRTRAKECFSSRYRADRLVYCEATGDVRSAIEREKQIKGWRRERKIALIESVNPYWRDLSKGLGIG